MSVFRSGVVALLFKGTRLHDHAFYMAVPAWCRPLRIVSMQACRLTSIRTRRCVQDLALDSCLLELLFDCTQRSARFIICCTDVIVTYVCAQCTSHRARGCAHLRCNWHVFCIVVCCAVLVSRNMLKSPLIPKCCGSASSMVEGSSRMLDALASSHFIHPIAPFRINASRLLTLAEPGFVLA